MYAQCPEASNILGPVSTAPSNKVTQLKLRLDSPTMHDFLSTIHALTGLIDGIEYHMVRHGALVSCWTRERGHFSIADQLFAVSQPVPCGRELTARHIDTYWH